MTLVFVDPSGRVLGAGPPLDAGTPWWQEVGAFAGEWQVLRLLHGDRPAPPGGHVTYLAETATPPPGLRPVDVDLRPHPKRAAYAEVGGPAATVAWALGEIARSTSTAGGAEHGPAEGISARQQRTWNLSAIWSLRDAGGETVAWLKQVPGFFGHEPVALRLVDRVAPGLVPPLLAAGPHGRMLLGHVPGRDGYGAGREVCGRIAEAFHPVQAHFAGRVDALRGIPDGRRDAEGYAAVAEPFHDRIDGLADLIEALPKRLAAVDECGLPATLVHGDLHPGNVRIGDDGRLTILDWGDCFIGHPAFDILRLTERIDEDPDDLVRDWAYRWHRTVPGSEPRRAAQLLRPVAALRAAATYAAFLEDIEPSEWPYHAADVPACLAAAVDASIV